MITLFHRFLIIEHLLLNKIYLLVRLFGYIRIFNENSGSILKNVGIEFYEIPDYISFYQCVKPDEINSKYFISDEDIELNYSFTKVSKVIRKYLYSFLLFHKEPWKIKY